MIEAYHDHCLINYLGTTYWIRGITKDRTRIKVFTPDGRIGEIFVGYDVNWPSYCNRAVKMLEEHFNERLEIRTHNAQSKQ